MLKMLTLFISIFFWSHLIQIKREMYSMTSRHPLTTFGQEKRARHGRACQRSDVFILITKICQQVVALHGSPYYIFFNPFFRLVSW